MMLKQRHDAAAYLAVTYGVRKDHAVRAVEIACELGEKALPVDNGVIYINARTAGVEITDSFTARRISRASKVRYPGSQHKNTATKEGAMPRRAAAAQAEPETEETEELDLTVYATKPVTVVAEAYTEWIEQETGYKADERTVYLAMSLRRKFQHDQGSRDRIAELREERNAAKPAKDAAEPEEGEEDAPPKPARSRAKPAAPKPAPSASKRGTTAPSRASTGRTRGKAAAAAPF
jgi:hypothetical protein